MSLAGKSVSEMIEQWNAGHAKRSGESFIKEHITVMGVGTTSVARDPEPTVSNRTKVVCPSCGASYNGRAAWVKKGEPKCYRCTTKETKS